MPNSLKELQKFNSASKLGRAALRNSTHCRAGFTPQFLFLLILAGANLLEERIRECIWGHMRRNGSWHACTSCRAYRPRKTHACCELTTTILVAEVRESPHITQTNDLPGHRQHKLHFATPLASLFHFLLFYLFGSCNGPIGFSFPSHSSYHGSVGQKKKSMGDRELLWDTLVGRGESGPDVSPVPP